MSRPAKFDGKSSSTFGLNFGYIGVVTTVPLADAKNRLSKYVADVERTHDRVTITRHGRTAAVLISADDLAELEETVDVLATPGALKAIAEGLADLAAGRVADNTAVLDRYIHR
jgi:prevent-host-death family protein